MLCFKIDFETDSEIGNMHGDALDKVVGEVERKTDIFNTEKMKNKYILLLKIEGKKGSTIVIINELHIGEKVLKSVNEDFLSFLGINITKLELSEISFSEFADLMDLNYKFDNKSPFQIFRKLNFYDMGLRQGETSFSDDLVEVIKRKNKIVERINTISHVNGVMEEVERIYNSKNKKFVAHPVHYAIFSNNKHTIRIAVNILISSLYNNNRIVSKRVDFINLERTSIVHLEKKYELSKGATIVLEANINISDSDYRKLDEKDINEITDLIKKYQHEVLTVVVFNNKKSKTYSAILEKLPLLCFVEFEEESIYYDRALVYLKDLASKKNIKNCDALLAKLTGKESRYSTKELNVIFEEWYNIYIRENIFTNYSTMKLNSSVIEKKIKSDALATLNEMIGLKSVKTTITEILNYHKAKSIYKNYSLLDESTQGNHLIFTGNPGTAKTTVARLFAQIMKDAKILSHGHIIEAGRADLVDKYLGGTAPRVKDKFKQAEGGVLFIDEAYSLVEDRGGMYGDEAINTIVQEMENKRDSVIVIFAGYKEEMLNFVNRNPGIKSRISFHVNFEDYNSSELLDILKLMVKNENMILDDSTDKKLLSIFERSSKIKDFGNGRYARNIFENALRKKSSRLVSLPHDDINIDVVKTFIEEDFEEINFIKKENDIKVGF